MRKEIAQLGKVKLNLEKISSKPDIPFEKLNEASKRIAEISSLRDEKEMHWLELSELME